MSPHEGQWEPAETPGVAYVWKRRPYQAGWLSEVTDDEKRRNEANLARLLGPGS